jgi:hypothetical protein
MRSQRSRFRLISLVTLFAFVFVTFSTSLGRTARAATPAPDARAVQPIELREVVWGESGGPMTHTRVAFQDGKILDGSDLYRAIGRPDLSSRYDNRVATKLVLLGVGMVGLLAGGIATGMTLPHQTCQASPPGDPFTPPTITCQTEGGGVAHDVALGVTIASPLAILAAMLLQADPLGPAERNQLIDGFNASLAHPAAQEAESAKARLALDVAPTVSPDSVGAVLSGRF